MRSFLNAVCFICAVIGMSLVCHTIGTWGHRQGVDELLIAGTVFPVAFLGLAGIISKFFEVE